METEEVIWPSDQNTCTWTESVFLDLVVQSTLTLEYYSSNLLLIRDLKMISFFVF